MVENFKLTNINVNLTPNLTSIQSQLLIGLGDTASSSGNLSPAHALMQTNAPIFWQITLKSSFIC